MIRKSELTKDYYKPKEVGAMLGREQRTISNKVRSVNLDAIRTETNSFLMRKERVSELLSRCGLLLEDDYARRDAIYVRFSSHEQKNRGDLERQFSDIMYACEK